MNPKMKYWLEDNKDKLYIGGAVLSLCGVALSAYMMFNKEKAYNTSDEVAVSLADYVLAQKGDGDLQTISTETNTEVGTLKMGEGFVAFNNENLDGMYVYQDDVVHTVNVTKDGAIELVNGFQAPDVTNVQSIQTNGLLFGFETPKELVIANKEGQAIMVFEDFDVDGYHLGDEGIYLSEKNEIKFVDYAKGETQYIDIGDITTRFSQHGDTVVVRNNFGSGENVETVLNMKDGSLHIDELKRVPFANKVDVQVPKDESKLVYVQERRGSDETITSQELATLTISGTVTDEEVDLSDFTLPMDTTEEFASFKSMAVRGFLYDWTDSGVRIIEMRNGREVTRLRTHSEEAQLFVPIHIAEE